MNLINSYHGSIWSLKKNEVGAPAGVVRWTECQLGVTSSIPGQGTCLGCGLEVCKAHCCFSHFLSL